VSSPAHSEAPRERGARRGRAFGLALVLLFLLANLVAHALALAPNGPAAGVLSAAAVLIAAACALRPSSLHPVLALLGASLFLCGFHAYRPQSLSFELAVSVLAAALVLRLARSPRAAMPYGMRLVRPLFVLYASLASVSLLLLPPRVLEHRAFLEGLALLPSALLAFPKDPLYPIASVDRLWLLLIFAWALAAQPDADSLFRRLFRGVAWAALLAVVLGLLDFLGLVSLARYNLSQLFFGAAYRRLQSTFGNPSWFASFVACALPFLLLAFLEAGRTLRWLLAACFPIAAAALFLSGARASWLAAALWLGGLLIVRLAARRRAWPLPSAGRLGWAALALSLVTFGGLAARAYAPGAPSVPAGRMEGLAHEIQLRGLGLQSPRRVAAAYALALAKQRPLLGLGYESFNIHLRAQLELPGSPVARVVNDAVAADPGETVFDDSHDTYLQVLTGTGALGLVLWLCACGAAVLVTALALVRAPTPTMVAVTLGMLVFHFYGLFQGMAYIPAIFFLLFAQCGYAMTLDPGPWPAWLEGTRRPARTVLAALVLLAVPAQLSDRGYASLKRALGVAAYLPDEALEFEGFYRPELGPQGEFRWMAARGIVNIGRAAPFRLSFGCGHPDLERAPVVVTLRFEGRELEPVVCRRPGTQERRFALGAPGALRLSVSRTFRPEGEDRRELGVALSAIRWE
jgi:hypothetical protein